MLPSWETKARISRKLLLDLVTAMPACCTAWGSSGVASCSLFSTCTWAMFGSVPAANVRFVMAVPVSSLVEDRYSRLSRPFICCSITWTTVFSTVLAEAPG